MTSKSVAIFGGTSAIAHEVAKYFANQNCHILLIGRNQSHLQSNAADLISRGAGSAEVIQADLADTASHPQLWSECIGKMPKLDTVLIAHGYLGNQADAEASFAEASKIFSVNALSYISLLTHIANHFEKAKMGTIAVISSVAGDRGRKSNYVYGASKAAVICFLSGLRNRLFSSGVKVIDIRPGFIDTPMTHHLEKKPLVVSASIAGKLVYQAIQDGMDVVYVPTRWKWVMLVIRLIPERIFKRLNL